MATIQFKRGTNLANLAIADGQFIVNTAERAIYVDVGEERLRIGDFVKVATLNDLPATANETALYLVDEINCLCYYDGSAWIQINRDTGATSFETSGTGNVVTGVSYDAATRKLTLTRGMTAITPDEVDTKISTADAAVRAYVDEKTQGIATDTALGELQAKVTAAEGEIDDLQEQVGTGTVASQIDAKITALDLANTYDAKGSAASVQGELTAYKTANDAALAAETGRATTAEEANAAAAAAAQTAADNAQKDVDALEAAVGTPATGKTVVQMIADAQTAATYDDTQVKADITANAAAIAAVKEDVDTFFADADLTENAKDTLKEIQEYIDSDAEAAAAMTASIQKNAQAITAVETRATTLEGEMDAVEARATTLEGEMDTVEGKVTALEGASHAHANKAELDLIATGDKAKWDGAAEKAHEHANKTVLDGISAEKVAAWDGALEAAKAYTDTAKADLAAADEANLTAAKSYTDTQIKASLEWGTF